jgi:hypothetical protein
MFILAPTNAIAELALVHIRGTNTASARSHLRMSMLEPSHHPIVGDDGDAQTVREATVELGGDPGAQRESVHTRLTVHAENVEPREEAL